MDYIQEELLRQREALAALLLGGGEEKALVEDPDGAIRRRMEEVLAGRAAPVGRSALWTGGMALSGDGPAALAGGVGAVRDMAGTGRTDAGEIPEAGELVRTLEARSRLRRQRAARGGRTDGGTAGLPAFAQETAAEIVTLGEAGTAVVGGTDTAGAGTLSRVFQRDARRYDGGFTLY